MIPYPDNPQYTDEEIEAMTEEILQEAICAKK